MAKAVAAVYLQAVENQADRGVEDREGQKSGDGPPDHGGGEASLFGREGVVAHVCITSFRGRLAAGKQAERKRQEPVKSAAPVRIKTVSYWVPNRSENRASRSPEFVLIYSTSIGRTLMSSIVGTSVPSAASLIMGT